MSRPRRPGSSDNMLWAVARALGQPKKHRSDDDDREPDGRGGWLPRSGTDEQIEDRLRRGMSQSAIRAELGCGQTRVQAAAKRLEISMRPGKRPGVCVGTREYKSFRTGATAMLRGTVALPDTWATFTAHYDEIADAVVLRAKDRFAEPVREPPTFARVACEACDPSEGAERANQHAFGCPHFSVPRNRKRQG